MRILNILNCICVSLIWTGAALASEAAPLSPSATTPSSISGDLGTPADAPSSWVSLEPNRRPTYVGIHGGTAPLTLVRSPSGVLVALTGQTGNDFTRLLRGQNGSQPGQPNATSAAKPEVQAVAQEITPTIAPEVAVKPPLVGPVQPVALTESATLDEEVFAEDNTISVQEFTAFVTGNEQGFLEFITTEFSSEPLIKKEPEHPTVLIDSIAEKPENYPTVVFADGAAANDLLTAEGTHAPYGLGESDSPATILLAQVNEQATRIVAKALPSTPLKLKDYRATLNLGTL